MIDKLQMLGPEIVLLVGATVILFMGLFKSAKIRLLCPWAAILTLLISGGAIEGFTSLTRIVAFASALPIVLLVIFFTRFSESSSVRKTASWVTTVVVLLGVLLFMVNSGLRTSTLGYISLYISTVCSDLAGFVKLLVVVLGVLLVALGVGVPTELKLTGDIEDGKSSEKFDAGHVIRGEYFAFMLLSLAGVMLVAGANDLIWLFLALELVSLPTYVMIAITKDKKEAQESAVKYFYLGAFSAAVFLYGFVLLYGAAGTTVLLADNPDSLVSVAAQVNESIKATGQLSPLFMLGFTLAFIGIFFKIAAVPMHFYAADVYQGAATSVTGFLSIVPKVAGFVALIVLLNTMKWPLPAYITNLVLIFAVLTMCFGNVLGLLQTNVKRMMAYSSIAHSGYMLVALVCVNAMVKTSSQDNGVAALLFYLLAYGLANIAVFGVLSCIRVNGEEAQTLDDIAGFARSHRRLGAVMAIGVFSLIGLPPLATFIGKIYIFGAALTHEHPWIVVIAVINSAVSAGYYLKIVGAAYASKPNENMQLAVRRTRQTAACLAAAGCILLGIAGDYVAQLARNASPVERYRKEPFERPFIRPVHAAVKPDPEAEAREAAARQDKIVAGQARNKANDAKKAKKTTKDEADLQKLPMIPGPAVTQPATQPAAAPTTPVMPPTPALEAPATQPAGTP
jgi:NADH-quinone oxidoreductase subunit N